ncbi:hypothetical protein Droror1_Dr00021813 [Drosera rotundifolia]
MPVVDFVNNIPLFLFPLPHPDTHNLRPSLPPSSPFLAQPTAPPSSPLASPPRVVAGTLSSPSKISASKSRPISFLSFFVSPLGLPEFVGSPLFLLEWSMWNRDVEEEIVPTCRELGIGIAAYTPLRRGFFAHGAKVVENLTDTDYRKAWISWRNKVDKYEALQNLDVILLCLYEIVDGGMILETDANVIVGKVAPSSIDSGAPLSEQVEAASCLRCSLKVEAMPCQGELV